MLEEKTWWDGGDGGATGMEDGCNDERTRDDADEQLLLIS